MVFFGLCFLYCSRLSGLWTPPIPGWTPPIQSWTNAHPMKRTSPETTWQWWGAGPRQSPLLKSMETLTLNMCNIAHYVTKLWFLNCHLVYLSNITTQWRGLSWYAFILHYYPSWCETAKGYKVRLAEWSKAAGSSPVTLNMGSGVRIPHLTKHFSLDWFLYSEPVYYT